MAARIRGFDWSANALGPMERWPQSLKTAVDLLLGCGHAMQLAWGAQRIFLYNDAYAPMLGERHPGALGQPFGQVWPEIWDSIGPMVEQVFAGRTVRFEDLPLVVARHGYPEQTRWTFSYSPVHDETGAVAGLLNVPVDVTARHSAERARDEAVERLARNEARFRALVTAGAASIYRMSADWRRMYELDSRTLESAEGPSEDWPERYILEEDRPQLFAAIEAAIASKSLFELEHRVRLRGGGVGWVMSRAAPLLGPDGRIEEWFGAARDVGERRRAVERLRESEARQAYVLRLSDALQPLGDPAAVRRAACRILGERLGADRVVYAEVLPDDMHADMRESWLAPGVRALDGRVRMADFGASLLGRLRSGSPLVVDDVAACQAIAAPEREAYRRLGIAAYVSSPLLKDGRFVANLNVHQSVPRRWTPQEVALIGETAERTWAAAQQTRAETALRRSEAVLAAQREALVIALNGGPLEESLGVLGRRAAALLGENLRTAFFLANPDGASLRHVVGMPPDYAAAVDGFVIGPNSLACGLAAHSGEAVITPDVRIDPRWAPWRDLAARYAYRACWSFPIRSAEGEFVGAFSLYWSDTREANDSDVALIGLFVQSASIIIARDMEGKRRQKAEDDLRESEARFRQFARASAAALWIRDAATLDMEFVSPAASKIYGVEPRAMLGDVRRWAALVVPEHREGALAHLETARRGETGVHVFRIQRRSDLAFRWVRETCFPLRDDGHVPRIGGIAEDITETRQLEERQGVLLAELQHRVRNIMAVTRSMANRTASGAAGVEDYRALLEGRLMALARVQTLLADGADPGRSLREIVENELSAQAHHGGQFELDGPEVTLSPKAVEVLTLAFHELATNALKYGALSTPQGRLRVRWEKFERRGASWLALDWIEDGAPPGPRPARRGFGSELIEARVPYELHGSGRIELGPEGARCRLEFPLEGGASILETDAPRAAAIFGGILDMSGAPDLTGRTVLVVEDDYFMASDTAAALRGAGAQVLGPCPTLEAAQALLRDATPTHAVLDLNLGGGGPQFELARELKARDVPFIFLTGYDADVAPPDLQDVARLQKPAALRAIVEAVHRL